MYFEDLRLGASVEIPPVRNEKNGLVEISIDVFNQNGDLVMKNVTEAISDAAYKSKAKRIEKLILYPFSSYTGHSQ